MHLNLIHSFRKTPTWEGRYPLEVTQQEKGKIPTPLLPSLLQSPHLQGGQ